MNETQVQAMDPDRIALLEQVAPFELDEASRCGETRSSNWLENCIELIAEVRRLQKQLGIVENERDDADGQVLALIAQQKRLCDALGPFAALDNTWCSGEICEDTEVVDGLSFGPDSDGHYAFQVSDVRRADEALRDIERGLDA